LNNQGNGVRTRPLRRDREEHAVLLARWSARCFDCEEIVILREVALSGFELPYQPCEMQRSAVSLAVESATFPVVHVFIGIRRRILERAREHVQTESDVDRNCPCRTITRVPQLARKPERVQVRERIRLSV
jgi:hypothetical protein